MVKVKICGVTRSEDARACIAAGVHAIGLNFAPESKRFLKLKDAENLVREVPLPPTTLWAGVFVNPTIEQVVESITAAKLNVVQLHGEETPGFVDKLKPRLPSTVALWKAFRVAERADLETVVDFRVDGCLLDAKAPGGRGGIGQTFDWQMLKGFKRTMPLVLAGGLNPQNVSAAVRTVLPDWVDTASGVETAPSLKSSQLIKAFVDASKCVSS